MFIALGSLVLVTLIWTGFAIFAWPLWIPLAATVVVTAIAAALLIAQTLRRRKSASRALAASRPPTPLPGPLEALQDLQSDFLRGLALLERSRLGSRTRKPVYAVPWVLVLGPTGTGKTAALRHSGLRFSSTSGEHQHLHGTERCQWWMSEKAVFLDTAGRYATDPGSRAEWSALLGLLSRHRPKRPLNGVLLAVSVAQLEGFSAPDLVELARSLRSRLDEVTGKLGVTVPIYVIFTQADRLPGFREMFASQDAAALEQMLGFTAPISGSDATAVTFAREFDALYRSLVRHCHERAAQTEDIDARIKIQMFPQHFADLRERARAFVEELFAPNILTDQPLFRGAYFTSALQDQPAHDTMFEDVAQRLGLAAADRPLVAAPASRGFFIRPLLEKVVLRDRKLARRTTTRRRRHAALQHTASAGMMGCALLVAALPAHSYQRNRDLVAASVAAASEAMETTPESAPSDLAPMGSLLNRLEAYREKAPPHSLRLGMYQGERIENVLRQRYADIARAAFVAPLFEEHVLELGRFVARHGAADAVVASREHRAAMAHLRVVLLLTPPLTAIEPGLDAPQREWLASQLVETWLHRHGGSEEQAALAKAVALRFLELAVADTALLFRRDEGLVAQARTILRRSGHLESVLDALLSDVEAPDLDLRAVTGSTVWKNDGRVVAGAFTRAAWEGRLRARFDALPRTLIEQQWVLGWSAETAEKLLIEQTRELRSLYFERYIAEWNAFLAAAYVDVSREHALAKRGLDELTRGETPPLRRLCQYVAWNTELKDRPDAPPAEPAASADNVDTAEATGSPPAAEPPLHHPGDVTATVVSGAFSGFIRFGCPQSPKPTVDGEPSPPPPVAALDHYQDELELLRDALSEKLSDDGPERTKALLQQAKAIRLSIDGVLSEMEDRAWAGTLKRWLEQPVDAVVALATDSAQSDMTMRWCDEIVAPLRELQSQYPFELNGKPADLRTFAELFAPKTGKVWTHYAAELQDHVSLRHGGFVANAAAGRSNRGAIDPRVVRFLNRARTLSESLFENGAPRIPFEISIDSSAAVSEIEFELDGTRVVHRNGPARWQRLSWPGDAEQPAASITARGRSAHGKVHAWGSWALFELLEHGTVSRSRNTQTFTVRWDLRDQNAGVVTVRIRPVTAGDPFFAGASFMDIFRHRDLVPPDQLLAGGPSCASR